MSPKFSLVSNFKKRNNTPKKMTNVKCRPVEALKMTSQLKAKKTTFLKQN